jgi:cytochrome P450
MSAVEQGRRVPPGPDRVLSVREIQRDPLGFLAEMTGRFGDIVRYEAEQWTVVLVNRPEYVKHVLQDNHLNYAKEGTPDVMMLRPILGDGLLTSDGDTWYRQRRMAQPAFHRERIERFASLITDATAKMLGAWETSYARTAEPFELTDEMTRLTTGIVAQALFGVDVTGAVSAFGQAVQAMNEYMGNFDPMDPQRYMRFRAAHNTIGKMVDHIVASRREGRSRGDDFLEMLLQARDEDTGEPMSDRLVRDQVMTLLMAGHETTAKALTWSLFLLDRHPEALRALEGEVERLLAGRAPTVADLSGLRHTWMVLQEAMRLYPPVWIMSRLARAEDEIAGFVVPAGALVIVSPYALHRNPALWEDPEAFRPERFLPELAEARPPFAFFPFSGGPRQCIGKSFASVELQLVLPMLVQAYRIRPLPGHPVEPQALVTLRPRQGLPVTLQSRAPDKGRMDHG